MLGCQRANQRSKAHTQSWPVNPAANVFAVNIAMLWLRQMVSLLMASGQHIVVLYMQYELTLTGLLSAQPAEGNVGWVLLLPTLTLTQGFEVVCWQGAFLSDERGWHGRPAQRRCGILCST